jgi:hypothetical protein
VTGSSLDAYFLAPPAGIRIDGLFADWAGLTAPDSDPASIPRAGLDIQSVGGVANASGTFFMLQVAGPLLEGVPVPQKVPRAVQGGGGGGGGTGAPPPRITGEDIARVYIDSNSTDSVGLPFAGMHADYMVEVRGSNGRITRQDAFRWQSGWVSTPLSLQIAKDATAIEGSIGLNPSALNGTRMAFQTSDWSGNGDVTDVIATRSSDPPSTRTDGGPVPLPEFDEVAVPVAIILGIALLSRGARRRGRRPRGSA